MDRLRRVSERLRRSIDRTIIELETELSTRVINGPICEQKIRRVLDTLHDLDDADQQVLDAMLDADADADAMDQEMVAIEQFKDKVRAIEYRVNEAVRPGPFCGTRERSISPPSSDFGTATSASGSKKKTYKLPKIEIKKFNGEVTEWLSFWSQFEKIHQDEELHDSDKFQYLIQAMTNGTRAKKLVESYPQSATNYQKVIDALQDRYGDKTILTEVYVRQLLKLVVNNVGKGKETQPLSVMYDEVDSHLRVLESLGVTSDQTAAFLYPLVESSLPIEIIKVWQRSPSSGYSDGDQEKSAHTRLKSLMQFLRSEVKGAERLSFVTCGLEDASKAKKTIRTGEKVKPSSRDVPTAAGLFSGDKSKCLFCDKSHDSKDCGKAQTMSLHEKKTAINGKKCCFFCLKSGHQAKDCKSFVKCIVCGKKHVTLMCPELPAHQKHKEHSSKETRSEPDTTNSNLACSTKVILKTLMVCAVNKGKKIWVRALIDDGSQRSYILKSLARELGLESRGTEDILHALFTGVQTSTQRHQKLRVFLKQGHRQTIHIDVLDQDKICGKIPRVSAGPWMDVLKSQHIWVSDICSEDKEIQMLIGADVIGKLLTGKVLQLDNGLTAVETTLGWTLMGKLKTLHEDNKSVAMTVTSMTVSDATIQQLWDLEGIGIQDSAEHKSKEEKEKLTKEHFLQTVSRSETGRYSVRLPWIDDSIVIPNNKFIAEKRLESTTRKIKGAGKYTVYDDFFKAWEEEGIIEEVKDSQPTNRAHYLPHRPVYKPGSETTPVRPVFDASCKGNRSPSLNDCLEKGPNLMERIPTILLRFREKKIGIISDIRKAFLMVEVDEQDRDFLRFLWWEDPESKKFKIYRHRRVVFGVNCSPFLLAATIEYHLNRVDPEDQELASKLLKSLYVDNCVSSADTVEECKYFMEQSIRILADAQMELRQWEFGSGEVPGVGLLTSSKCGLGNGSPDSHQDGESTSVLGLVWNKTEDCLQCDYEPTEVPDKITKRVILSSAQKIFDPIGFTCPVSLKPKMLLQRLWLLKTSWDAVVDDEVAEELKKWRGQLDRLPALKIPRNVTGYNSERESWQIHTFCDASKDAYAAVVFLRTEDENGVSVQLMQAKARVAPIKKPSIPRLELLGCTIAARLTGSVKEALEVEVPTFYWSDSTTALAWIRRNDDWGTFVGNRVKEIIHLTQVQQWRFVPGILNPADLPSRGCGTEELLHSKWWEGPDWLKKSEYHWPSAEETTDEEAVAKEKKKRTAIGMTSTILETPWYVPKSTYSGNVRVMAWVKRFIQNCQAKKKAEARRTEPIITFKEFILAEVQLLRLLQTDTIPDNSARVSEILVTKNNDGLVCVKTKLLNLEDKLGFIYPIVLPNKQILVEQLIREQHLISGHAGVQFLVNRLRERFWILQNRRTVRQVIGKCVTCRRFSTKKSEVVPAPLPLDRVKTSKVFEVVGVDLAGPLYLKKNEKGWIVLFTCAVYRCVHLELIKSLSTEAFLEALSRFIARRGRPAIIYSDNGTNFVGTDNWFRKLDWNKITKHCGLRRIEWKFNPPSAAWWGGWWERLVRSIKDLLRRMLGKSKPSYEKLETYLIEIESIINGRPLTTVTEDPDDLTPAMFLHEMPTPEVKDVDLLDASGFQKLFAERKTIMEEFKTRFRKEYLALLVHRGKQKQAADFQIGDIVLIGADHKRRWEWPLARIIEVMPGKDGHVRVVRLKTATGKLNRPIQRLYKLEVSSKAEKESLQIPDVKTAKEVKTRSGRLVKTPQRYSTD